METQIDNISYTEQVTDETYKRMNKHRLGDDYDEGDIPKDIESENFHIKWDDTNRGHREGVENGVQGFIAETTFAQLLDQADIDYEWRGGKGEPDFIINGKTFDIKSRQSKKKFRNLIKDYCMSNSDTVDFYVLIIVGYHPINTERIKSVEFLGYISNKKVEEVGIKCKMYEGNDYESDKKEVHPVKLTPINELLSFF